MQTQLALHLGSALLLATGFAPLADIYVDQAATNCTTGTGTAVDPVCTIPSAIARAVAGDTIRIAPGTYLGPITLPVDLTLIGTDGQALTILDAEGGGSVVTIPAGVSGTLDGLTLKNGRGLPRGGGVNVIGNLSLKNSTVVDNETVGHFNFIYGGGGIAALLGGSTVEIDGCTIHNNLSDFYGGGISIIDGALTIRNSTISSNTSWVGAYYGGGVFLSESLLQVANSTFSDNYNTDGCAIFARGPQAGSYISDSTVASNGGWNSALDSRPGLIPLSGIEIRNTIVAGNTSNNPGVPEIDGAFFSLGHNLINTGGAGFVDGVNNDQVGTPLNPVGALLEGLHDNGGLTLTHALLPGSPAIDAGDPLNFAPFDQRGAPRPVGPASDIGAVEFEGAPPGLNLCNGDGGNQAGCTDCPCGNNAPGGTIGGCLNQAGTAARLSSGGDHSVSLPNGSSTDLRFTLSGAPALSFCILISGDGLAPGGAANPCFGTGSGVQSSAFDGLRCAIFGVRRHGGRAADSNGDVGATNAPWGGAGGPTAGIAGALSGFVSGQTRYFQSIYRVDALAGCMRGLNTSQAQRILFTP